MGACGSKSSVEADTASAPLARGKRQTGTGAVVATNNAAQASKPKGASSDPHSDTDTNGARNAAIADDLNGIEPVLSPPINILLANSSVTIPSPHKNNNDKPMTVFSPTFTGGSSLLHALPTTSPHVGSVLGSNGFTHQPSASILSSSAPAATSFFLLAATTPHAGPVSPPLSLAVSAPSITWVDIRPPMHEHTAAPLHLDAIHQIITTDNEGETISCSTDKTIVSYNWKMKSTDRWTNHSKSVECLVYSSKSKFLFSGSRDTTIRQWRSHQFKETQSFRGHTLPVSAILLQPQVGKESILISGSRDYSIRQWNVATGEQIAMKTLPRNVVTCMNWIGADCASPSFDTSSGIKAGMDFNCFLQGSEDSSAGVRLWDVRNMEVVASFPSSIGRSIQSVSSDPLDSNQFVSVSSSYGPGAEIRVWDRRKATSNLSLGGDESLCALEPLLCILAHSDTINSVTYLPPATQSLSGHSSFIATASSDSTLKLWDLSAASSDDGQHSRCTQVISYRDRKYAGAFTALAVQSRPLSGPTSSFGPVYFPSASSSSSSPINGFVLYAGMSHGMMSAWSWNPNSPKTNDRIELIAQTKAATTHPTSK